MVEDKKEYDLRLQEYAQLLDIRADRIKVRCGIAKCNCRQVSTCRLNCMQRRCT